MGWGVFLISLVLSLIADLCEISIVAAPLVLFIDVILGFILGFSAGARKQWKKWIAGFLPIPLVRVALLIWAFVSSRSEKLQAISNIASKVAPKV
jgi:ABC-type tungstate transport system substrate-binding protein